MMPIFENGDYKYISRFIEDKLVMLRRSKDFNDKYLALNDKIEELENGLSFNEKDTLRKIVDLFYETEEYYFAFSYCLGVKYGEDLKSLEK